MLANLFHIEVFQTTLSRVMEKYHDEHNFRFDHDGLTMKFALCGRFKRMILPS